MFDITTDALISKREFTRKAGVSRPTLNKYLEADPSSPKPTETPIGEMFIASEVSAWLSKFSPKMRTQSEVEKQAAKIARGGL